MTKIAFILAMIFVASSYASESCQMSCLKTFNQAGPACHKDMLFCMNDSGIEGTERFDYCQQDYEICLQDRAEAKDKCIETCNASN